MSKMTFGTRAPSANIKLTGAKKGLMYSIYRTAGPTCPETCGFLGTCYAFNGNVAIHSRRSASMECNITEYIKALPQGAIVRHLVSGDLMLNGNVDYEYIEEALQGHRSRPDVRGYGYTHAWRLLDPKVINALPNFTINASCENSAEVSEALAAGWDAVLVVDHDTPKITATSEFVVNVCPEQMSHESENTKSINCASCMLCARHNRMKRDIPSVVGFRAHGNIKAIESALSTKKQLPVVKEVALVN